MGLWEEITLPWGSTGREGWKIAPNNHGIVGTFNTNPPGIMPTVYSGFMWHPKKKFDVIEYLKAPSTTARGINDKGDIVGAYEDAGHAWHGFKRDSAGVYEPYEVMDPASPPDYLPGSRGNAAFGISKNGTIVGVYSDATDKEFGYVSSKGGTKIGVDCERIQFPGANVAKTRVFGINSKHAIVGRYEVAGNGYGYLGLLNKGKHDLYPIDITGAIPGAKNTVVAGINDEYDIVGSYSLNGVSHGFTWKVDEATGKTVGIPTPNVDYPGSQGTLITSIDGHGSFSGYFTDAGGLRHAFRFEL